MKRVTGTVALVLVFWLNFFAIVPLASMLGFATEELALRTNESIGGLLNATFGNAVEVIVSVLALKAGLVTVVQSSLIGSILSNVLLVLGMCFLLGGYKYDMQTFNTTAANTSSSLMAVSVMSLMMPTAYVLSLKSENISDAKIEDGVVTLSRMTAILLLFVYAGYLFFQLRTHKRLYADEVNEGDDDPETPVLTAVFSVGLLLVSTVMVAVNSEFLVDNLQEMAEAWHLPQTFVGLILLPIVGNAAEHLSACTFALKNKMNLAIGIAVGSSIQIALLVLPLMVIVGWIIQVNMTLYFGTFDTVVLFIAVLLTNYLIVDGQSNWLEGVMLLVAYLIIAIAFFLVPSDAHE
ncbi:hypothetical protein BC828DRAFT_406213 [Blastocladiella britannica]|nr:hypothetical protein BC828DRAFT_406213 [Blastocladiella britannica]